MPAGGREGRTPGPSAPDPRGSCDVPHATTLLQSCRPSCESLPPSSSRRGYRGPASRAGTHRSLSPHSSQQWPPLVISRADGCGRDSAFSGTHAPAKPSAPPSKSPSWASCPTPDSRCPGPPSAREPSPQPRLRAGGCVRASVCVSGCGSARARVAGDPRGPRPREARAGGGGQAAPSKPLAVGPAPRQAFSSPLPGGSPESSRPPWFTELAQPGSRGVLLLRSPRRKRRRKAGAPPTPTWGLILSRRDAAAPAKAEKVWSSGGRESLQSAAALPGGGPRQTPQSLGGGADRGHRLPERTAAVRPG